MAMVQFSSDDKAICVRPVFLIWLMFSHNEAYRKVPFPGVHISVRVTSGTRRKRHVRSTDA